MQVQHLDLNGHYLLVHTFFIPHLCAVLISFRRIQYNTERFVQLQTHFILAMKSLNSK